MRKIFILLLFLQFVFLGGCYDLAEINDSAVVTGYGWDLLEGGKFNVVVQVADPAPPGEGGQGSPNRFTTVAAAGSSTAAGARDLYLSFPRFLLFFHSSVILINENLARHGLDTIIDAIARNRNLRGTSNVYVVHNASVQQVFNIKPEITGISAERINDTLTRQEKSLGYYVAVTILDLLNASNTPGIEPVIPVITVVKHDNKDSIALDGMAVFKHSKMVGSLNQQQSQGYRWLKSRNKQGGFILLEHVTPDISSVSLEVARFRSSIRPEISGGKLVMNVFVETGFVFVGQAGTGNLLTEEMRIKLEEMANQEIKKQIVACILKSQALNSDILGYGLQVSRYLPGVWKTTAGEWDQVFPEIASRVEVKSTVKRSLLGRSSFKFY